MAGSKAVLKHKEHTTTILSIVQNAPGKVVSVLPPEIITYLKFSQVSPSTNSHANKWPWGCRVVLTCDLNKPHFFLISKILAPLFITFMKNHKIKLIVGGGAINKISYSGLPDMKTVLWQN